MRWVPLLAAFSAGCSEFSLEQVKAAEEVGTRVLAAEPAAVEFGVVDGNATVTETVAIVSTGSLAVNVESLVVSGSSAYTIAWPNDQTLLAPDDTLNVVVTYVPASHDDQAGLVVTSDADEPTLVVPLTGAGIYPAIEVDPPSLALETSYELPVDDVVEVLSVGTADLVISDMVVEGAEFTVAADIPATLAPGESLPLTVTYTPGEEGETVTGRIWLTVNTAEGYAIVPLQGQDLLPCIGLGESWDRGFLDAHTDASGGTLVLQSLAPEDDVCIDNWYVWISEGSQDLGAGDMAGDFGGTYPQGSLSLPAGDDLQFAYGDAHGPVWWCMELTQYTQPNADYIFTGARVPDALLDRMLGQDQDAVWAWMDDHPVAIAGRSTNYLQVPQGGGSGTVGLWIFNMGGAAARAEVRESVAAGYGASDFSVEPDRVESGDDGATVYVWDVSLAARELTGSYEHTLYDEQRITYTLTAPSCRGRVAMPPMTTTWQDSDGVEQTDDANPLVVHCVEG